MAEKRKFGDILKWTTPSDIRPADELMFVVARGETEVVVFYLANSRVGGHSVQFGWPNERTFVMFDKWSGLD